MKQDAAIEIISEHYGHHILSELVAQYGHQLTDKKNKPLSEEELQELAGEDGIDTFDWLEPRIQGYRLEFTDGRLIAIHEEAEYSEYLGIEHGDSFPYGWFFRDPESIECIVPEVFMYYYEYGNTGDDCGCDIDLCTDCAKLARFVDSFDRPIQSILQIDYPGFCRSCDVPGWLGDNCVTVLIHLKPNHKNN